MINKDYGRGKMQASIKQVAKIDASISRGSNPSVPAISIYLTGYPVRIFVSKYIFCYYLVDE